jgi:hypothetical protein
MGLMTTIDAGQDCRAGKREQSIKRPRPLADARLVTLPVATQTTLREGANRRYMVCLEIVEAMAYEVRRNGAIAEGMTVARADATTCGG